jgi:hypothetical protein
MPHRRSKYPPDSRQTMEPPVSNGGVLFPISFCPYGVIVLHPRIYSQYVGRAIVLFFGHFRLNASHRFESRLEAEWKV